MKLYECKDIVREHFGSLQPSTFILDQALAAGRRAVEKHANFWWMEAEKDFTLTINTQEYPITTSGGVALNLPNFKDGAWLFWRETSGVSWEPVELGQTTKPEMDLRWDTDDTGSPEEATIKNVTLILYPPKPDKAYNMRLYHWNWTTNPAADGSTDDLLSFFPEALIYGAVAWGYEILLKDLQGAAYWRNLLMGRGGEIAKIKAEHLKRGWQDQIQLIPRLGPGMRRNRLQNLQIYGDRVT